ncbi:MAG: hypothetical protein M3Q93_01590, partial [Gemmatimonadota bacterium]|nr:hypothetical protein [Gemmatimonadota bacterium]
MIGPLKLFDLFAATLQRAVERWPQAVRPETGLSFNFSGLTISPWLDALNRGVSVSDVRTAARPDRVAIEARLRIDNLVTGYPLGFPFALASMPDVLFRIPDMPASAYAQLFASLADEGAEFVVERLPVEIRFPIGLLIPHPSVHQAVSSVSTGAFTAGSLDGLQVVLRRDEESSVLVHARLHCNAAGEVTIRTAVPITIGKCALSGLPCLAVHGLELIASPDRATQEIGWLRHEVTPWAPSLVGPIDGCFAVRTVELDHTAEPLKGAYDWLHGHSGAETPTLDGDTTVTVVGPDRALTPEDRAAEPTAEFVLGDLVVPFWSPWVVPIPRHITIGMRRRVIDAKSPAQIFAFDRAPIRAYFSREPLTAFIVEALFYRSQPTALIEENFGLTLDASIAFGGSERDRTRGGSKALQIGIEEQWTLSVGYRRDWDQVHNLPAVGGAFDSLLHWTIASFTVDIVAIRLGYSLGRGITENAPFKDSVEATVDLYLSSTPPNPNAAVQLKSLDGGAVGILIEGIGWRLGAFQMKGASSPAGVVLLFANRFGLILQELGLTAEDGATYFSISGGILLEIPSGFTGALTFQRLRFRVAGDPGTPPVKLDGFFFWLKTTAFDLQVGGYYRETKDGATVVKEFGLTGSLEIGIGGVQFRFGLDLIIGSLRSPAEQFEYLLLQIFFRGSVQISLFELRGVRVLFARNMQPKLAPVDRAAQSLRYFNWYRGSNPLTVPGDRRLASWKARNDSLALGVGCNGSFAKMGAAIELGVFVLYVTGPDEQGLLIVIEVMLLSSPKPVGYLAIEWDIKNGRFSGVLGVELTVGNFVEDAPEFLNAIAKLTGTLFFSNDPPTFAIGRLADERTWLQVRVDIDLFVRAFILIGACLEIVDGGPKGCGLVVRIEGQINGGIVQVRYHAGLGFLLASFSTGSVDYSLVIWIEAGLRIVLFGFLRFGISARAELRVVGAKPTRGELELTVRLETPWFLPDVTWTLEHQWGQVMVADLASSTQPLLAAGATEGGSQQRGAMHAERAVPAVAWNGEGTAPVFSIAELRNGGSSESGRLARFAAATDVAPIATDATLAIGFSVSVNDLIGFGTGVAPSLGNQDSGDLTLVYDLVAVAVRRRSRFGADQSWHIVDERRELTADFSDPSGVTLTGAFLPAELTMLWNLDVRVAAGAATRQLLINAATPFEFATSSPEIDEQIVGGDPAWPCCHGRKPAYDIHEVTFRAEPFGPAAPGSRRFTLSASRLHLPRPLVVRPPSLPGLDAAARIGAIRLLGPGVVWRADLVEDAAFCFVRLAAGQTGPFRLVAYDAAGTVVGTRGLVAVAAFQTVAVPGTGPIRRLELQAVGGAGHPSGFGLTAAVAVSAGGEVEVDRVAYVSLRAYLDSLREQVACDDRSDRFQDDYAGKGKLFLLPNHDYEVAVTTRITGAHPSRPPEAVETIEYLYCRTKGLPGLNAVGRIGAELEPYVRSAYAGGRSLLYREEPIAMQISENYSVALPLSVRPAGTSVERTLLVRMQLLVEPTVAVDPGTVRTATSEDWIVTHRTELVALVLTAWTTAASAGSTMAVPMTTIDPYRIRLADLTQRPGAPCPLPDPRDVTGTVLFAPPQGEPDPRQAGRELWPGGADLAAGVRLERSGYVDRASFEPADATAFTYGRDGAPVIFPFAGSGWGVAGGRLVAPGGAERTFAMFGESDWNHVVLQSDVAGTGASVGVGIGVPAGPGAPAAGLFALIETGGGARRLVIRRRTAGAEWLEVAAAPLPAAGATPDTLTVTAFDDRLRAAVGEVVVEAERGTARDGRLALVAQGSAEFGSLRVRGVTLYAFPVRTSRFVSFADHFASWKGTLPVLAPDTLGAGTTTSTVPALWGTTAAAISAAMAPAVSDAAPRDALFRQWVGALGLPLAEEVNVCELSRYVESGATTLLVLESPEPIDCSLEVSVRLQRRVAVPWRPWDGVLEISDRWRLRVEAAPMRRPAGAGSGLAGAREKFVAARQRLLADEGTASAPVEVAAPGSAIEDVVSHESGLHLELAGGAASVGDVTALSGALIVERVADGPEGPRARVHRVAPAQRGKAGARRL